MGRRRWGATCADGMFGENLTTSGLDVDGAVVGERWRVGVGAARGDRAAHPVRDVRRLDGGARLGAPVHRARPHRGLPGGGRARGGAARATRSRCSGRPGHGITVPEVFRAFTGDDGEAERVLAAGILGAEDHRWLEQRLARRRASAVHDSAANRRGLPRGR